MTGENTTAQPGKKSKKQKLPSVHMECDSEGVWTVLYDCRV